MSSTNSLERVVVPRPSFHLTPRHNWMNDPNGLVFDRGLWHVFYQYNPEGSDWGNMSWGHATSPDLRRWTEHAVALRYRDGEQIYSGSVVATRPDEHDRLTAYYTSAYGDGRQAQSRATSVDGGYTWELDPGNPVLDRGTTAFRDPKIIRSADEHGCQRWVMLAVEADDRQVLFYASSDLRVWEHVSTFGPIGQHGIVWECPDLVPLAVDGDPSNTRWVLFVSANPVGDDADPAGSSMHYVVGSFDGTAFTPDKAELIRVDHGRDFYAGVTFDQAPNGESIMLGWMNNWRYAAGFPSTPWRGAMSLPRRLALRTVGGTARLTQEPPAFVRQLLAGASPTPIAASRTARLEVTKHTLLHLDWDPTATGLLQLTLRGNADSFVVLDHDPASHTLRIRRDGPAAHAVHRAFPSTSVLTTSHTRRIRLLLSLDGPLLEVFVNGGEATASNLVLLGDGAISAELQTSRDGLVNVTVVPVLDPAPTRNDEPLPPARTRPPAPARHPSRLALPLAHPRTRTTEGNHPS